MRKGYGYFLAKSELRVYVWRIIFSEFNIDKLKKIKKKDKLESRAHLNHSSESNNYRDIGYDTEECFQHANFTAVFACLE